MPKSNKFFSGQYLVSTGLILVGLTLGSLLLSACGVYDGYPTAAPVTATPNVSTPAATSTPLPVPTYPPLPTSTPRPALPATPANVKLTKTQVLQQAYTTLLGNYYQPLNSSDVFEVGLIGIKDALKDAGVSQPDVPIPAFTGNVQQDYQLFLQAFTITFDRYKANLTEDKMTYAALQHSANLLVECQTPITGFYPPDQAENFVSARTGQSNRPRLGINIVPFDNTSGYFITRVVTGSPAEQSGLKYGDAIVAVDGQDVTKVSQAQVLSLLAGNNAQAGSKVKLTVRRTGGSKQDTVEVARGPVQPPLIEQKVLPDNIGYLHVNFFPVDTTLVSQIDKWFSDLESKGAKGYVIDLRGSRGGSIATVQAILSHVISGQDLVYLATRNQQGQSDVAPMKSLSNVTPVNKPVAVLVDQDTNNEAEIFALAVQNKRKGSVFGANTAGCPVASTAISLADNSILNLALYRAVDAGNLASGSAPSDNWIKAVTPDVPVSMDLQTISQGQDAPLNKAIAFIKSS